MSDDPEACVATPRVSVWEPDWDREKKQEAMQQCTFAVDALLAQVHIKITRPDDAMGSQVLRLLEDTEALQEWFDTNKGDRAVPMTFNRDETDSIGSLVLFETSPGASLSYKPLKLDGTPKKEARTAPGLALETVNMTEFQYGEVFATDGFFNVPSDSESPGRMSRAFLSPLLGFMVVAELHASETVINPNTQKRFPRVVQFRIDLLFATTFGVTMKVRRLTHCSCALVLFQLCVPVPVAADRTVATWALKGTTYTLKEGVGSGKTYCCQRSTLVYERWLQDAMPKARNIVPPSGSTGTDPKAVAQVDWAITGFKISTFRVEDIGEDKIAWVEDVELDLFVANRGAFLDLISIHRDSDLSHSVPSLVGDGTAVRPLNMPDLDDWKWAFEATSIPGTQSMDWYIQIVKEEMAAKKKAATDQERGCTFSPCVSHFPPVKKIFSHYPTVKTKNLHFPYV